MRKRDSLAAPEQYVVPNYFLEELTDAGQREIPEHELLQTGVDTMRNMVLRGSVLLAFERRPTGKEQRHKRLDEIAVIERYSI